MSNYILFDTDLLKDRRVPIKDMVTYSRLIHLMKDKGYCISCVRSLSVILDIYERSLQNTLNRLLWTKYLRLIDGKLYPEEI